MTQPPVPMKEEFWKNMVEWAGYLSTAIDNPTMSNDTKLALVYYDGQANAQKVLDYIQVQDAKLEKYTKQCHDAYVTNYVIPNAGAIQGYRTFGEGQLGDIQVGNARANNSLLSLLLMLANQNYLSTDTTVKDVAYSRECAYALNLLVVVKRTGKIRLSAQQESWRSYLLNCILDGTTGHVATWKNNKAPYFRPFMAALTAHALIRYHTYVQRDPRILLAVRDLCDLCVNKCWKEKSGAWGQGQSFLYTDRTGFDPGDALTTPDLNMLIAPMFGWVFNQTATAAYRTMGDAIWKGGVSVYDQWGYHAYGANLGTKSAKNPAGKQYNQQLFWGPEYIKWAEA